MAAPITVKAPSISFAASFDHRRARWGAAADRDGCAYECSPGSRMSRSPPLSKCTRWNHRDGWIERRIPYRLLPLWDRSSSPAHRMISDGSSRSPRIAHREPCGAETNQMQGKGVRAMPVTRGAIEKIEGPSILGQTPAAGNDAILFDCHERGVTVEGDPIELARPCTSHIPALGAPPSNEGSCPPRERSLCRRREQHRQEEHWLNKGPSFSIHHDRTPESFRLTSLQRSDVLEARKINGKSRTGERGRQNRPPRAPARRHTLGSGGRATAMGAYRIPQKECTDRRDAPGMHGIARSPYRLPGVHPNADRAPVPAAECGHCYSAIRSRDLHPTVGIGHTSNPRQQWSGQAGDPDQKLSEYTMRLFAHNFGKIHRIIILRGWSSPADTRWYRMPAGRPRNILKIDYMPSFTIPQ